MAGIIPGDRPWKLSVQEIRLSTIERRIDEALDRVDQCAEQLKKIQLADRQRPQH